MYTETINKIKSMMESELQPMQMKKLDEVLHKVFAERAASGSSKKEKRNLIKQFIDAKRIEGCAKRTEKSYSSTLKFFAKSIKKDVRLIRTDEIRDYLLGYQKINNCSNVTLDNVRRILSTFYNWLEEEDFILKSPMRRIHRIKAPTVIKPALSDDQIELIRKAAESNTRNIAIIDMLLSSGIRVSELVRLNRSSIDLNTRNFIVHGKGAKQRVSYFDVKTKIEIEKYLESRKDKNNALFVSAHRKTKSGTYSRLTINSIEKIMRDIGAMAEIDNVHPHRFRRTMATRAIDKGMPIEQVQVLLGHAKIDTTLRYANVLQANVHHSHQKYIC